MKIKTLEHKNKEYPSLLTEVANKPKHLYYLGSLQPDRYTIAVVGTRKPTAYGKDITYTIARDLAEAGVTIVSGLAYGVDTIAHEAAVDAGKRTIAVLGNGLDRMYPAANRNLAKKILQHNGLIISEYEEGTPPLPQHFPARNRIVAGLSLGVLVTEAAAQSGSLITANFALEQNRAVMATPGAITNTMSAGTNNLLKAGATPVTDAQDVLAAVGLESVTLPKQEATPASPREATILELLEAGIADSETLIEESRLTAAEFNQAITLMEISGKVRNLGAGKWVKK